MERVAAGARGARTPGGCREMRRSRLDGGRRHVAAAGRLASRDERAQVRLSERDAEITERRRAVYRPAALDSVETKGEGRGEAGKKRPAR